MSHETLTGLPLLTAYSSQAFHIFVQQTGNISVQ